MDIARLLLFTTITVFLASAAEWDYNEQGDDWDELCATGTEQTPINFKSCEGKAINFQSHDSLTIYPDFKTLTVTGQITEKSYNVPGEWGQLVIEKHGTGAKTYYDIAAFHFHAPSEHTIEGKQYDLEMHCILYKQGKSVADVFGIFFHDEGEENDFIQSVIDVNGVAGTVNLADAIEGIDKIGEFMSYMGSKTTPPCEEDTQWWVFPKVQKINTEQLKFFTDQWAGDSDFANGYGNNRIVQDSNYIYRDILWYQGINENYDFAASLFAGLLFMLQNQIRVLKRILKNFLSLERKIKYKMEDHNLQYPFRTHFKAVILDSFPLDPEALTLPILDSLWLLNLEFDSLEPPYQQNFVSLIDSLLQSQLISIQDCLLHLQENVLKSCDLISSAQQFKKRQNRIRTKLVQVLFSFEQHKFNLLREQNEGYSALFEAFRQSSPSAVSDAIGKFDLDIHKVIDLVVDIMEKKEDSSLIQILQEIDTGKLVHIIGFKFQALPNQYKALCRVTAELIKSGLFGLDEIWTYLNPSELQSLHKEFLSLALQIKRNSQRVSLLGSSNQSDFSALKSKYTNQKLSLLAHLVKQNCWKLVQEILLRLKSCLIISVSDELVYSICEFFQYLIDPVYFSLPPPLLTSYRAKILPTGDFSPASNFTQASQYASKFLSILGPALGKNTPAFIKMCRFLSEPLNAIKFCLLPGVSLSKGRVTGSLWELLQGFGFSQRYALYEHWRNYKEDSLVLIEQSLTIKKARAWIKRLARENVKEKTKELNQFVHVSPSYFLSEIVTQISSYSNIIPVVLECFQNCHQMLLDMIPYSILRLLYSTHKPKIERVSISQWMQNIASFTGDFYCKYHQTELRGILMYVVQSLQKGQVVEMSILKNILTKMSGWDPPQKLTDKMLNSLSGGSKLKLMSFQLLENTKKAEASIGSLCRTLSIELSLNMSCAMELILRASQQAGRLKQNSDPLNRILYDIVLGCITHMIDLMSLRYSNPEDYERVVPNSNLKQMNQEWQVSLPTLMYMVRPGMDVTKLDRFIEDISLLNTSELPSELFALFWTLCLSDIKCSKIFYQQQIEQNGKYVQAGSDRLSEDLRKESSFLQRRHQFFKGVLARKELKIEVANYPELVQQCFLPRLVFSPTDAIYSAAFIRVLNDLKIPDFPILELINQCVKESISLLSDATQNQAYNIGLFFLQIVKLLNFWEGNFLKECQGKPGFSGTEESSFTDQKASLLQSMNQQFCDCFDIQDLNLRMNELRVLSRIVKLFPASKELSEDIQLQVESFTDSEYENLKLLATCYLDKLRNKFVVNKEKKKKEPILENPKDLEVNQKRRRDIGRRDSGKGRRNYDDRRGGPQKRFDDRREERHRRIKQFR